MRTIISPAKRMVGSAASSAAGFPRFVEQSAQLLERLQTYSAWELEHLLRTNPALALQAFSDFQEMDLSRQGTPAVLTYRGLQYQHLDSGSFSPEELDFAGGNLFILSAFYGLLGAMDGILPYRLDFMSRMKVDGKNLYHFWGSRIYQALFETGETVVNLSSGEYFKAVTPWLREGDQWITCDFLTNRWGTLRMIPTEAKMARGEMARFIVQRRVSDPLELWDFTGQDYRFCPALSAPSHFVFTR